MSAAKVFDVIVVGSGAAGSLAAKVLTEGGLETLVLDAGPRLDPLRDFPPPRAGDRPGSPLERLQAILTGQPVQSRGTLYRRHLRHLYVDDRQNPYTTGRGRPFYWIRGRQIGGRLHTWARLALRMSDLELHDWPIAYADLAPRYDRVEELFGLDGEPDGLPQLPDGRYRAPRPLNPGECELRRIVEERWPDRRVIQARVLRQELRQAPLPLRDAEATGRLTLRPDAVVRSIPTDPVTGKARGVELADRVTKRVEEVRGRLVFLCASAFESVRILLNSGIGATSGVLGRHIADHVFLKRNGVLPRGVPFSGKDRDPYDFGSAQGFYIPSSRTTRGFGICGCIGRHGAWWWMGVFGEMLMRAENRITLHPTRRDAWGVPAAHIECALSPNDRALVADAGRALDEIIEAAGLGDPARGAGRLQAFLDRRSFTSGVARPGLAIHELGGARMGSDPASSVLDPLCRVWDAPNVVVSDGACFVSGGYQNPALTIMALSMRAAESAIADFDRIAL